MKNLTRFLILCLNLLFFCSFSLNSIFAESEQIMSISGYLSEKSGEAVANESYDLKISLWDTAIKNTGNKSSWEEEHKISFNNLSIGFFEVKIGSLTEILSQTIKDFPYVQIEIKKAGETEYEILDPDLNNTKIDRILFQNDSILFKDNTFIIQNSNLLNPESSIKFGNTINEFLSYNQNSDTFKFSGNLIVEGEFSVEGDISKDTLKKIAAGILENQFLSEEELINGGVFLRKIVNLENFVNNKSSGTNLVVKNNNISLEEESGIIWSQSENNKDTFTEGAVDSVYSKADDLIYILNQSKSRVYALDKNSKEIIHEFGTYGNGQGGIYQASKINISADGLLLAISTNHSFVSIWKRDSIKSKWHFAFDLGSPNQYGNSSDGKSFWGNTQAVIRNSDKHIFVGSIYGLTKDFEPSSSGLGGVVEYDENGNFVDIPLRIGKKSKNGSIGEGEARRVSDIAFDEEENLWVASLDNQVGKFDKNWNLIKLLTSGSEPELKINQPYKILPIKDDFIIVKNHARSIFQVWNLKSNNLLGSFGDLQSNEKHPFAYLNPSGLQNGPDESFLITDFEGKNINLIKKSILNSESEIIYEEEIPENAKNIIINVSKDREVEVNKLRVLYKFFDDEDWQEEQKLISIPKDAEKIKIAVKYSPLLIAGKNLLADSIEKIELEYVY